MRIEPENIGNNQQTLGSDKPFFSAGWYEGSGTVWKMTNKDEWYPATAYNAERDTMVPVKINNAVEFQGFTVIGFGWAVNGMELQGHDWVVVDQDLFDQSWVGFINEIVETEGLNLPI